MISDIIAYIYKHLNKAASRVNLRCAETYLQSEPADARQLIAFISIAGYSFLFKTITTVALRLPYADTPRMIGNILRRRRFSRVRDDI